MREHLRRGSVRHGVLQRILRQHLRIRWRLHLELFQWLLPNDVWSRDMSCGLFERPLHDFVSGGSNL